MQSSASHVDSPLASTLMSSWLVWSLWWSRGCQGPFILLWGMGLVTGVGRHWPVVPTHLAMHSERAIVGAWMRVCLGCTAAVLWPGVWNDPVQPLFGMSRAQDG